MGGGPTGQLGVVLLVDALAVLLWMVWARTPPAPGRRVVAGLALAATVWLLGLVLAQGYVVGSPRTFELGEASFAAAQLFVVVSLIGAVDSWRALWLSLLDSSLVAAVAMAVGALVGAPNTTLGAPSVVFGLAGSILGVWAITLGASAGLARCGGVPLSVAILAAAEIPLTAGAMVLAWSGGRGAYPDLRLVDLVWAAGAIVALIGASVVTVGADGRIRLPPRLAIPRHPAGGTTRVVLSACALAFTLGVGGAGAVTGDRRLTLAGLLAAAVVGTAMAVRSAGSIRSAEAAYRGLDQALAVSERTRDVLLLANEELARANVQLRANHIAVGAMLNVTDERTNGRLRELVEQTGDDLLEILEQLELQ